MSKVIFRIAKLKSWGEIGAAAGHNLRTRPTPGAGQGGFVEIVPLTGSAPDAVREKIGDQTIRKNGVLAVEAIVTASPEYFRPDVPERAGYWQEDRLKAWRDAVEPWIKEKFPHAISVVLHLDESTPHYQIIDVPLDEKGKLNCRGKYGGKETLIAWQDDAARAVSALGIERGIEGSAAKHERIKAFYEAVNTPTPPLPAVRTARPQPLPARSIAQQMPMTKAKEERDELERAQAAQNAKRDAEKQAQQNAIMKAYPAVAKKANAVDLAEAKKREAEATAAKLSKMKNDAEKLRALPLDSVLKKVYGATLEKGSRDAHNARKYVLPDSRKIAISTGNNGADVWVEQGDKGQRGAINLVMHLDGLDYKAAVRLLQEHFDSSAITSEHARVLVSRAEKEVAQIKENQVAAPAPDPARWDNVRRWLHEVRGMPKKLIDMLHEKGLIYADSRGNATFKRTNGGAFQRGTGPVKFHRSIGGSSCGPFIIPGTDKKVILVEAPIDAVAIKAANPTATVVASGGDMLPPSKLRQWLARGAEIFAAHDADKRGDQVAKDAEASLGAKRMRPPAKDWAETVKNEPWRVSETFEDTSQAKAASNAPRGVKRPAP